MEYFIDRLSATGRCARRAQMSLDRLLLGDAFGHLGKVATGVVYDRYKWNRRRRRTRLLSLTYGAFATLMTCAALRVRASRRSLSNA